MAIICKFTCYTYLKHGQNNLREMTEIYNHSFLWSSFRHLSDSVICTTNNIHIINLSYSALFYLLIKTSLLLVSMTYIDTVLDLRSSCRSQYYKHNSLPSDQRRFRANTSFLPKNKWLLKTKYRCYIFGDKEKWYGG